MFTSLRDEYLLQTQSWISNAVCVLKKEMQSSVSLRGITGLCNPDVGGQKCFISLPFYFLLILLIAALGLLIKL